MSELRMKTWWLVLMMAVCAEGRLLGAGNPGDEVVIVYNRRVPESKGIAEHYAERRQVPAGQIFGFDLSTTEEMSRSEFQDALQRPLARSARSKEAMAHRIAQLPCYHQSSPPTRSGRWSSQESATPCSVMVFP